MYNKKYALLTLFGEKEGVFSEVLYVIDPKNPDRPILFDTKEQAEEFSKYVPSWHVVKYDE